MIPAGPFPPDERIDAPPRGMQWSESIRPDGGVIVFSARPPPTRFGIWLIVMAAALVLIVVRLPHMMQIGSSVAAAIFALIAIVLLALRWRMSAVSAAEIAVDGSSVRVRPAGMLGSAKDLPLASVDYCAAQTEIETRERKAFFLDDTGPTVEAYRWYPVCAHLATGQRIVVAAFAERECALFLAQRLQMLLERAKSVAGRPQGGAPIVPKPYR